MQPDEVMSPILYSLPLPILSLGIIPLISLTAHLSLHFLSHHLIPLPVDDTAKCQSHLSLSLSITIPAFTVLLVG
jgi:hypothetical protein